MILTTNLPFSEWTQVFPNGRLCKALLDRITDRAPIIETAPTPTDSAGLWRNGRNRSLRPGRRHPRQNPRTEGRADSRSSILGDPGREFFPK